MTELAWAAGLFDGEGSIFSSTHLKKSGRRTVRIHIALAMTEQQCVERFWAAMGIGTVVSLRPQTSNRKPQWRWQVTDHVGVIEAFERLRPWLSIHKQKQGDRALAARAAYLATPLPPRKRKRYCLRGHDLRVTLYQSPKGQGRYCRECAKVTGKRWRDKQGEAA